METKVKYREYREYREYSVWITGCALSRGWKDRKFSGLGRLGLPEEG